jgi:hypothetical protein
MELNVVHGTPLAVRSGAGLLINTTANGQAVAMVLAPPS